MPKTIPVRKSELMSRFGRANGYFSRNLIPPKMFGNLLVG